MTIGFVFMSGQEEDDRKLQDSAGFSLVSGKYFVKPLRLSTRAKALNLSGGLKGDLVAFFCGSEFEQQVAVIWTEEANPGLLQRTVQECFPGKKLVEATRLIWLDGSPGQRVLEISNFLRQSATLTRQKFQENGATRWVADANGVGIETDRPAHGSDRFKRLIYVNALSVAYRMVLSRIVDDLSEAAEKNLSASELHLLKHSKFLSRFYFIDPVRSDTIELNDFYGGISKRQKIDVAYNEVTEQLRLLSEQVRLLRMERRALRDAAVQRRLSWLSIVIAVIGLIQIAQVTPRQINEFIVSWSCLPDFKSCFAASEFAHEERAAQAGLASREPKSDRGQPPGNLPNRKAGSERTDLKK